MSEDLVFNSHMVLVLHWILKSWKENPKVTRKELGWVFSWQGDTPESNKPFTAKEIEGFKSGLRRRQKGTYFRLFPEDANKEELSGLVSAVKSCKNGKKTSKKKKQYNLDELSDSKLLLILKENRSLTRSFINDNRFVDIVEGFQRGPTESEIIMRLKDEEKGRILEEY